MAELVLGPEIDIADPSSVHAWLERHGVAEADREAMLDSNLQRLIVYRALVRDNLWQALSLAVPRTMARLGDVFRDYFDLFLQERGPRTHYLRDVTRELLDFCESRWRADERVAPFIWELANHESLQIEIGAMRARAPDQEPGALELDKSVMFIEAVKMVRYQWAVHRLSEDECDRSEPVRGAVALLVYRSPEHEVRYLELTPLAAAIVEPLLGGRTLESAMHHACEAESVALNDGIVSGAARLLADLAERGVLLGARP
jgi:hypothetical protein